MGLQRQFGTLASSTTRFDLVQFLLRVAHDSFSGRVRFCVRSNCWEDETYADYPNYLSSCRSNLHFSKFDSFNFPILAILSHRANQFDFSGKSAFSDNPEVVIRVSGDEMLSRKLLVVADDYGIGPEVSRGILELMQVGVVTSTVLLVNSPFVEQGVQRWKLSGRPGEMGWHPNLTMDEPIAKPGRIRSLLDRHGKFAPLGTLALRMLVGHLKHHELVCELEAQLERYYDLIGRPPDLINGHKHVHAFPMVNRALLEVLKKWRIRPYVRRVVEPQASWLGVPGARLKRAFLTFIGRLAARKQKQAGLPGNDGLAGITDPKWVEDSGFYARWLERTPGRIVELMVHPGHYDETLIGRDCSTMDGQLERRVAELKMLMAPTFLDSCRQAGFRLAPANPANTKRAEGFRDAA